MWDHIINTHLSELLCTKTKESRINEHKICFFFLMDNLHFLPNNILTRFFKELIYIYIYMRMTINNI